MPKFKAFVKQFHWKILLIRILVNAAALSLTAAIIPDIYFVSPTLLRILIISIGLGILNAIIKPIILLLTGQFIFATFGLLVVLVNALILFLLERLFSNSFVVNNFFWALVGGALLGLISNALENLLGLTPPIVPEDEVELRRRIEAKQQATLVSLVSEAPKILQPNVETQSVSEIAAATAALEVIQVTVVPDTISLPDSETLSEPSEHPAASSPPAAASQIQESEPLAPEVDENTDNSPIGGAQ